MTQPLAGLDDYVDKTRPHFERTLAELVGIPTISADPAHAPDITRGAKLAVQLLQDAGFKASLVPTNGNPVVLGHLIQDPRYPTVTLYNHLDVQPADPADWKTDPFKLQVQEGRYIGRGATDDKGPALTALMAIRYATAHHIALNFQVIWELEEEIGSRNFEAFVKEHRDQLATDSVLVSDTIWIASDRPAIPVGLRGLMTFELSLKTGEGDAHSGLVGGGARNPLGELAGVISECYDARTGQVHIPGFYDDVTSPTEAELKDFAASGFSVEGFQADHHLSSLRTTDPMELMTRVMAAPTFEVHGIVGGYTGPGVKTVVPSVATAKLSTRLVPAQNPDRIFTLIKDFILARHPDIEVRLDASAAPYLADTTGPYATAAVQATIAAFGVEPAFIREGGSIGAVLTMHEQLHAPVMMLGLSLPEHGYHASGEFFDWHQAAGGIKMFANYFAGIAKI